MTTKRTITSQKAAFHLFKKKSKLTCHQIAKLTGFSVSHLKKVGCGDKPISDKLALVLSSRFGVPIDRFLSKSNGKLLNYDGEEWHPSDTMPPGTAPDYDSSDFREAYIKAVEACATEVGYSLPPEPDNRFRIAKAIDWFNPLSTDTDIKKLKPHRAEPARNASALFKKWDKRNSIGKKVAEIPLQIFFNDRMNEFLRTARRTARKDIMELLELLLVDASHHPESPLIAEAIIKGLLSIRDEFGVQKRCKVPQYVLEGTIRVSSKGVPVYAFSAGIVTAGNDATACR